MSHFLKSARRFGSAIAAAALLVAGVQVTFADSAEAAVSPPLGRPSDVVTADALPTAQINGVAWDQEVVGDTVYVGGSFTAARPAGAAAGSNESPRSNAMAYTLSTGTMTGWNPNVNGTIRTVAVSPDGNRIYIGGDFTQVNGRARGKIAAFDTATGNLVENFAPPFTGTVHDIAVTGTTVYVAGSFQGVGSQARQNLAAVNASNGALLAWAPSANLPALTLDVTEDHQQVIVGGQFENINGAAVRGLAKLDASNGDLLPWPVVISNAGPNAAVASVKVKDGTVYGSGWHFGAGGNQEGPWRIDIETGDLIWVADCHGDTYDVYPAESAVYTASHSHYCGNVGLGFPQYATWKYQHTSAWSHEATGTNIREVHGYANWKGYPSPSSVHWYPETAIGSYTGMSQASWTVEGSGSYVAVGGEFPRVNGQAQQGLVRFATLPIAPGDRGIRVHNNQLIPDLQPYSAGAVKVSWTAGWDMDDRDLTYEVRRTPGGLVHKETVSSNWWHTPAVHYIDEGLTPGQTYQYAIWINDSTGNRVFGSSRSIVAPANVERTPYAETVLADSPTLYWPLNDEAGSSTIQDHAGGHYGVRGSAVTLGATNSAISGDRAVTVNGSTNGRIPTFATDVAPQEFSAEVWFRTSTSGRLLGFGDLQVGNSGHRDRQIYISSNGRVNFGIQSGGTKVVTSSTAYNNNQWHQAVATLKGSNARLYVDGVLVGQRNDITDTEEYIGHWRLGGDSQSGWPSPGNANFNGGIDELSIYDRALTPTQVQAHYVASGRAATLPSAPADEYGQEVFALEPDLYWRLNEKTGSTAADAGQMNNPGTYQGGNTKNQAGALIGVNDTAVLFNGSNGYVAASNISSNPQTFSTEAWFRTTSTRGGKIIGFGNQRTALSSKYDRHTYMLNDGRIAFGVYTGVEEVITTPKAYNDGEWHHVVSTLDDTGMRLYVDGTVVATGDATSSEAYDGYWRAGGDRVWSGATSNYLSGTLDEIAVYSQPLTDEQVAHHHSLGSGIAPNISPVADFVYSDNHLEVTFDASGSSDEDGTIESYDWDFGDGETGSGEETLHHYAESGTYEVKLTVTDDRDASDTTIQVIDVVANQPPSADFDVVVTDLQASFDAAISSDEDGVIESYIWDFGDGETDSGVAVTRTYEEAGTYTVTLTVTDDDGDTAQVSQEVTVTDAPVNQPPEAGFSFTSEHLMVSVDASESSDENDDIVHYAWDFGDGTSAEGLLASHTYAEEGTYEVTLTVTDGGGLSDTVTNEVTVVAPPENQPPTAVLAITSSDGLTVNANATDSFDSDGEIVSYEWDFGSGFEAGGETASFTFADAGTYLVHLRVTDDDGATDTAQESVTVVLPPQNQTPNAAIDVVTSGLSVTLMSTSTDPDGQIIAWEWDLGDGSPVAESEVVSHTYAEAGTYQVSLIVTDNEGATDQVSIPVNVAPLPPTEVAPTATFATTADGLTVAFDASASSDPDGSIVSYTWSFGDGTSGSGSTPTHTYLGSGSYLVTLTVVDNDGLSGSDTQEVVVDAAEGASTFATDTFTRTTTNAWGSAELGGVWTTTNTASLFSVQDGQGRIRIPNAGSGPGINLTTVSAQDVDGVVDLAFDKPVTGAGIYGTFKVRRSGTNDYQVMVRVMTTGTQVVLGRNVNGVETALASTVLPWDYQPGETIRVRFQAEGDGTTALRTKVWRVGDAEPANWQLTANDSTAALQNPGGIRIVTYLSGSATNAPVIALVDNLHLGGIGAPAVNQAPVAAFSSLTDGLKVELDASNSSDPDGTITSYAWNFGDGATGEGPTVSHTYSDAGSYQVALTVTDDGGASHQVTHEVSVNIEPEEPGEPGEPTDPEEPEEPGEPTDPEEPEEPGEPTDPEEPEEPANEAPIATFTVVTTDLSVSVDGTASSDPDGSLVSYSWDWGDSTPADSDSIAQHVYAEPGTYTITLTVTDDDGDTAQHSEDVAVVAPENTEPIVFAQDSFDRDAGLVGQAEIGGNWTQSSGQANAGIENGALRLTSQAGGQTRTASLNSAVSDSTDLTFSFRMDELPSGSARIYVSAIGRAVGSDDYRARWVINSSGGVQAELTQKGTVIQWVSMPASTIEANVAYNVRLQVFGTGTTYLQSKIWAEGTEEPTDWQLAGSDSTASLQTAGYVGVSTYAGGGLTPVPYNMYFDDFQAREVAP